MVAQEIWEKGNKIFNVHCNSELFCILPLATLILIPMEDIFMEKKSRNTELVAWRYLTTTSAQFATNRVYTNSIPRQMISPGGRTPSINRSAFVQHTEMTHHIRLLYISMQ